MSSVDLFAPNGPVLIFDGVCNLCNWTVSFLVARDRDQNLRYTSNDSTAAKSILANAEARPQLSAHGDLSPNDLSPNDLSPNETVLLYDDGVLYERSEAVFRTLTFLPMPWRALSVGRFLPAAIRDRAYRLVAANRYRLFGKSDTCRIPTPEERELFL